MSEAAATTKKPETRFTVEPERGSKAVRWRMQKTLAFLADQPVQKPMLDIGTWSQATDMLAATYGRDVDSTDECDFNFELGAPGTAYRTIFCFEVIEHLMNPLTFMQNMQARLHDDGIIALSTPSRKLLVEKWHFTEYTRQSLEVLFRAAGLQVVKYALAHCMPFWWHFTGFRPLYRLFFHHYHFFILKKLPDA